MMKTMCRICGKEFDASVRAKKVCYTCECDAFLKAIKNFEKQLSALSVGFCNLLSVVGEMVQSYESSKKEQTKNEIADEEVSSL